MSKKKDKATPPPPPVQAAAQPEALRRVSVLISEADYADMQRHFAESKPGRPLVSVSPPPAKGELTAEQREKRKAYRLRPEIRERSRAYRKQRAAKLRALLAKAKQEAAAGA